MKHSITTTATLLALFAAAPFAPARAASEARIESAYVLDQRTGTIQRVAQDGTSFALEIEGQALNVKLQETTKFTLDGQETTRERALVIGRTATVTFDGDMATKVAVSSPQ